jgi:hypothetical protein
MGDDKIASGADWTIKKVSEPKRDGVTKETIQKLSRDRSLRGIARIAKKYAK